MTGRKRARMDMKAKVRAITPHVTPTSARPVWKVCSIMYTKEMALRNELVPPITDSQIDPREAGSRDATGT
jgi:hypothetical protein